MRRLAVILVLTILAPIFTVAAQNGLALLEVETGARPSGMGGAFVSMFGDPNVSVYNPAGAVNTDAFAVTFGYNSYWENVNLGNGLFVAPMSSRMTLHGGIRYAGISDIEGRDRPTIDPNEIALFDANDVSFKAGVAYRISPVLSAGIAAGWVIEKIEAYRGSGFNLDLGLLAEPTPALALGASVTSLGSDISLQKTGQGGSDDIPLPTTYRLGGSYRYLKYIGALDLVVVDDKAHVHVGAEGNLDESISVRAGYMAGYDSKDLTAGVSLYHRNFSFDYAFVPYSNDLGTSHLFNLSLEL